MAVDSELTQLFANLGDAIRDVPAGPEHEALYKRFFAVIVHLQNKGTVSKSGQWNLQSRKPSGRR